MAKYKYEKSKEAESADSALKAAETKLSSARSAAASRSPYADAADAALKSVLDRQEFSWSADTDPLYEQYRKKYTASAKTAMKDVLGRATALTGGWGNSYATGAASDAYSRETDKLGDVIPELYELAYGRYKDETGRLRDNAELLYKFDDADYKRRSDAAKGADDDRDYYAKRADTAYSRDSDAYERDRDAYEADRQYGLDTAKLEAQKESDARDYELAMKKLESDYGLGMARISASSGGKSNSSSGGSGTTDGGLTPGEYDDIVKHLDGLEAKNNDEGFTAALRYLEGLYTSNVIDDKTFLGLREIYIPEKFINHNSVVFPKYENSGTYAPTLPSKMARPYTTK